MTEYQLDSLKNIFSISLIIQFGNIYSFHDIDLLIVSDDFIDLSNQKRKDWIKNLVPNSDPLCLTNKEYYFLNQSDSQLIKKIRKKGKLVHELNPRI